jgi:hypothetical protein
MPINESSKVGRDCSPMPTAMTLDFYASRFLQPCRLFQFKACHPAASIYVTELLLDMQPCSYRCYNSPAWGRLLHDQTYTGDGIWT